MTISKDRVKPSPTPDCWKLKEIFATGVVLGAYLAIMTVVFFWAAYETNFFPVSYTLSFSLFDSNFNCQQNITFLFVVEHFPCQKLQPAPF